MLSSGSRWHQRFALFAATCSCIVSPSPLVVAQDTLSREEALQADLTEAVEMLEKKQDELLIYDFMPAEIARRFQDLNDPGIGRPTGSNRNMQQLPDELRNQFIEQLKAAQTGKVTWNRDKSLAWVQFTTKPIELIPAKKPGYLPGDSGTAMPGGFGSEIDQVLDGSVELLKSNSTPALKQFVLGVLPTEQAKELQNEDAMQRMLSRLQQHPEMVDAMIRDLMAAKEGTIRQPGDQAVIDVAGNGLKINLQKVAGSWRLAGLTQRQLAQYQQLATSKIAASVIPAQRGTLVLAYTETRWRLMAMPTVIPVP